MRTLLSVVRAAASIAALAGVSFPDRSYPGELPPTPSPARGTGAQGGAGAGGDGDDWPRYGHDAALSGRSTLRGDIASPRLAWSFPVAGTTATIEVLPSEGGTEVRIPANAAPGMGTGTATSSEDLASRWSLGPALRDIDGSGGLRPAPETFHERWAKLLPGVPGVQRVAWSQTWTTARICRLQLFAYEPGTRDPDTAAESAEGSGAGRPRLVWQTDPPEGNIFSPLDVVCDIDRDGILEVCVAAHYRILIFEGTTGRLETRLDYHGSRPYGWLGVLDVDADGQRELVTLGDFQSHLDVLEYDASKSEGERLSVKWRRDIESDISRREKWPQFGPRPVVDVTGDARLEIAINLFGDAGDTQWHVQAIDASSGAVLLDIPRRYLHGTADVDGDGKAEILLSATSGVSVPAFSTVEIVRVEGGGAKVLWSAESARWASTDLPRLGDDWSTTAMEGMRHALVAPRPGGRPSWLLLRRALPAGAGSATEGTMDLVAMTLGSDGGAVEEWRASGIRGHAEAKAFLADAAPRALIELTLPPGEACTIKGRGARPIVVGLREEPGPLAPLVAARLSGGERPAVLAETAGGRIVAIDPPGPGAYAAARLRWAAPGRGMANGSSSCGVAAADLDGDGSREVLAGDEAPDGSAQLAAYRGDGSVLWRERFEGIPGRIPVWNRGGLTFWWPGRFREPTRGPGRAPGRPPGAGAEDVFVSLRRGFMHSDSGVLLDGRTGAEVWRKAEAAAPGEFHWGYAGSVSAAADILGDGAEEIVNLYPVCFWIADGRTGGLLVAKDLASRKDLPAWAAYGEPMVRDFTGDGNVDVLLDSVYILALLDATGAPVWHGPPRADYLSGKPEDNVGQTTETRHALVDLDGDGRFEIASAGYADGVRALDPRNGKILWSLAAPAPTGTKVAAADVDGARGDEVLYVAGDTLVAVTGDRDSGRILWTWKGPAALGLPALADLDGDGRAEIALRSAAGAVHCIDGPGR